VAGELPAAPLPDYLDRVEREAILAALAKTGFNRTAAAKLLGVSFRTLRYRMQRLGIRDPGQDGPGD
jgi:two-component system response regulator PilR (NtrC family)